MKEGFLYVVGVQRKEAGRLNRRKKSERGIHLLSRRGFRLSEGYPLKQIVQKEGIAIRRQEDYILLSLGYFVLYCQYQTTLHGNPLRCESVG